jgi:hypothetical protein
MSDIFEIIELKTKCEQILMDTFKLEDCNNNNTDDNNDNDDILSMLVLAERFSCLYLVERILLYLKFNFIIKMNKNKDNDNNNNNNFMTLSNINELSEETLNKLKNIYEGSIVTEVPAAKELLTTLVGEMDSRYAMFESIILFSASLVFLLCIVILRFANNFAFYFH